MRMIKMNVKIIHIFLNCSFNVSIVSLRSEEIMRQLSLHFTVLQYIYTRMNPKKKFPKSINFCECFITFTNFLQQETDLRKKSY